VGFEFPKLAKALAQPAEKGLGFDYGECVFLMLNPAGEKDEPGVIRLGEGRDFDLAVQDDQLLAKHGVFGNQLGFAFGKVGNDGECN
jgi:hypothetical protein